MSNLAQAAQAAVLDVTETYIKQMVDYVAAERERDIIKKELACLGYTVFESSANYIFFQSPFSFNLHKVLNTKGIRICLCANF